MVEVFLIFFPFFFPLSTSHHLIFLRFSLVQRILGWRFSFSDERVNKENEEKGESRRRFFVFKGAKCSLSPRPYRNLSHPHSRRRRDNVIGKPTSSSCLTRCIARTLTALMTVNYLVGGTKTVSWTNRSFFLFLATARASSWYCFGTTICLRD